MLTDRIPPPEQVRSAYNAWSWIYDLVAAPLERGPRLRAFAELAVQPGDRVLDAGVGTGSMIWRLSETAGADGYAVGIDFSPGMLRKAHREISRRSSAALLTAADVRWIPFRSGSFDAVYSAYVLDLLSQKHIRVALIELRRVLKPGGRIVALNMTKADSHRWIWFERFYRILPSRGQAWILGACRPVFVADAMKDVGFREIRRIFLPGAISSEIVFALSDVSESDARPEDRGATNNEERE